MTEASCGSLSKSAATRFPCLGYFLQGYPVLWSRHQRGQSTTVFCVLFVLFYLARSFDPRPSPNRDGRFSFPARSLSLQRSSVGASTSGDGDNDDGGTGNMRSNAGDGRDDGSNHSDDGSSDDDDDDRTKLLLELRCRLQLRRQCLKSQRFFLRLA